MRSRTRVLQRDFAGRCAAILWKCGEQRSGGESLRLTSRALKKRNIIDDIIPEPLGGRTATAGARSLEKWLVASLRELYARGSSRAERRYNRCASRQFLPSDPRALLA